MKTSKQKADSTKFSQVSGLVLLFITLLLVVTSCIIPEPSGLIQSGEIRDINVKVREYGEISKNGCLTPDSTVCVVEVVSHTGRKYCKKKVFYPPKG